MGEAAIVKYTHAISSLNTMHTTIYYGPSYNLNLAEKHAFQCLDQVDQTSDLNFRMYLCHLNENYVRMA